MAGTTSSWGQWLSSIVVKRGGADTFEEQLLFRDTEAVLHDSDIYESVAFAKSITVRARQTGSANDSAYFQQRWHAQHVGSTSRKSSAKYKERCPEGICISNHPRKANHPPKVEGL